MKLFLAGALCAAALACAWRLSDTGQHPSARGPLGHVRFAASALVAADSSGHGHDGMIQGSPVVGVPGHRGTAYAFKHLGSWIEVPSTTALSPWRSNFMFSAWVNLTTEPTGHQTFDVVRKGFTDTGTGDYKVEILPRGRVKCTARDAARHEDYVLSGTGIVGTGRWHHVGCARTGPFLSVIVDRRATSKRVALGSIGDEVPLSIGSKYGLEDVVRGRVDEVRLRIGSIDHSASGIESVGQVPAAIRRLRATHPVGVWRLDERAGPRHNRG